MLADTNKVSLGLKNGFGAGQWWRMPLVPALGEAKAGGSEASLVYRVPGLEKPTLKCF